MVTAAYRVVFEGWSKEAAVDELINGDYNFDIKLSNITGYIMNMDVDKIRSKVLSPGRSQAESRPLNGKARPEING